MQVVVVREVCWEYNQWNFSLENYNLSLCCKSPQRSNLNEQSIFCVYKNIIYFCSSPFVALFIIKLIYLYKFMNLMEFYCFLTEFFLHNFSISLGPKLQIGKLSSWTLIAKSIKKIKLLYISYKQSANCSHSNRFLWGTKLHLLF